MIYPIKILKTNYDELQRDINRVVRISSKYESMCQDNRIALKTLYKRQIDLVDAINTLKSIIETDDLLKKIK
jgi:hypothetical protein|tara:strand:- start:1155 stop:1370 length:216 start_codon:yes stop_codon:yes gene_type:complete